MTSTTDFDNVEITQQYSRINTRFELSDEELDNDNSSARLFERSRIKALAGEFLHGKQAAPAVPRCWDDSLFDGGKVVPFPPLCIAQADFNERPTREI